MSFNRVEEIEEVYKIAHAIYPISMGYKVLNLKMGHFQKSYKSVGQKPEFYQKMGGSLFSIVWKHLVPIYTMTVFLNSLKQKALFTMHVQPKNLHPLVWSS